MSCGPNRGCDPVSASACRMASCALAKANRNRTNFSNLRTQVNNLNLLVDTESGGYDPTFTALAGSISNIVAPQQFLFSRVGDAVEVVGTVSADVGVAAVISFRVSLPVATDFTAGNQADGVIALYTSAGGFPAITGILVNSAPATDDVLITIALAAAPAGETVSIGFSFMYLVLP